MYLVRLSSGINLSRKIVQSLLIFWFVYFRWSVRNGWRTRSDRRSTRNGISWRNRHSTTPSVGEVLPIVGSPWSPISHAWMTLWTEAITWLIARIGMRCRIKACRSKLKTVFLYLTLTFFRARIIFITTFQIFIYGIE